MRVMHCFQTELVSVRMKRTKESVNMEQKQIEYSQLTPNLYGSGLVDCHEVHEEHASFWVEEVWTFFFRYEEESKEQNMIPIGICT